MTDRELLKYASNAAQYEIVSDAWARKHSDEGETLFMGNNGPAWNPLTDDGDALRLAVKLKIRMEHNGPSGTTDRVMASPKGMGHCYGEALYEGDPYAATRRAIVRAAAEIGKDMK